MKKCRALSTVLTSTSCAVHIPSQRLVLFDAGGAPIRTYRISTSAKPPSCVQDSNGTPTGLHRIAGKIGADQPAGMVFKGRQPVGAHYSELPAAEQARNLITSRVLWLAGLEPGHNCGAGVDSYERYIYLHGTNHEDRIGQPFSGGCIELSNRDVIDLFDRMRTDDLVWIDPSPLD